MTSPDRFRRALAVTRLTRVAVTRRELEPTTCGVAMPVFGPGGDVIAAIELTVRDLAHDLQPVLAPLSIATRSLSRELAGGAPPATPAYRIPHPRMATPGPVDAGRPGAPWPDAGRADPVPEHGVMPVLDGQRADVLAGRRRRAPGACGCPAAAACCSGPELSADQRAQSSHQVPLRRSAALRQACRRSAAARSRSR